MLDVCNALDKLEELKAGDLFGEGIQKNGHVSGHMEQVRSSIARFEDKISEILEKQASYQEQISQCLDELDFLEKKVRNAYDREERRKEALYLFFDSQDEIGDNSVVGSALNKTQNSYLADNMFLDSA